MSGDLDLTLPGDAGFALSMNAMSSDFTTDFDTVMKNGNYVCGNGHCRINVDAMSGDVIIRRDTEAAASSEHECSENCITHPESCPNHIPATTTEHHAEPSDHH